MGRRREKPRRRHDPDLRVLFPGGYGPVHSLRRPGGLAQDDPRFFSFIYGSIGDAAFGEEEARKTREQVLAFQVMMLRHKPELLADYEARAASAGYVFRPQAEAAAWMDECLGR